MARAAVKVARSAFTGFDRKAMQFWHELAAEMNREWFLASKQRYESQFTAAHFRCRLQATLFDHA